MKVKHEYSPQLRALGWLWPPLGYRQRLAAFLAWEQSEKDARPLTLDVYFNAMAKHKTPNVKLTGSLRRAEFGLCF